MWLAETWMVVCQESETSLAHSGHMAKWICCIATWRPRQHDCRLNVAHRRLVESQRQEEVVDRLGQNQKVDRQRQNQMVDRHR